MADLMEHIKEAGVDMHSGFGIWSDDIDKVWYFVDEQHLADEHNIRSKRELDAWMHALRKDIRRDQKLALLKAMQDRGNDILVKDGVYKGRVFKQANRECSCCGAKPEGNGPGQFKVYQAGIMDGDKVFFSYLCHNGYAGCLTEVMLYPPEQEDREKVSAVVGVMGDDMDGSGSMLEDFGVASDVNY